MQELWENFKTFLKIVFSKPTNLTSFHINFSKEIGSRTSSKETIKINHNWYSSLTPANPIPLEVLPCPPATARVVRLSIPIFYPSFWTQLRIPAQTINVGTTIDVHMGYIPKPNCLTSFPSLSLSFFPRLHLSTSLSIQHWMDVRSR